LLQSLKKERLLELFIFRQSNREWFGTTFTQEQYIDKELTLSKMSKQLTKYLYLFKVYIQYSHKLQQMFSKLRILITTLQLMWDFLCLHTIEVIFILMEKY